MMMEHVHVDCKMMKEMGNKTMKEMGNKMTEEVFSF